MIGSSGGYGKKKEKTRGDTEVFTEYTIQFQVVTRIVAVAMMNLPCQHEIHKEIRHPQ